MARFIEGMPQNTAKGFVDGPAATCRWCGMHHGPRCPGVAAMEFHPDGTVKRVEFVAAQQVGGLDIHALKRGPVS